MRALRVLRVMRAVRVLKAAPEAMAVMNSMWVSLTSMGGFLLVLAHLHADLRAPGTRLYGGTCVFQLDEDAGRLSFDSFMKAMLTLFVTASGEDGFDVMHWTMEASGDSSAFFMISWMIISQILLSLLLALLIDSYSVDDDDEEDAKGKPRHIDSGKSLNMELIDLEVRMLGERSPQVRGRRQTPPLSRILRRLVLHSDVAIPRRRFGRLHERWRQHEERRNVPSFGGFEAFRAIPRLFGVALEGGLRRGFRGVNARDARRCSST